MICQNMGIDLGVCQVNIVEYLLELGGVDIILGVD